MAFESKTFKVARKMKLPCSDFSLECDLNFEGEMSKILHVSAQAVVKTKEVLEGIVDYTGTIESNVVYMTVNGEINSLRSSCEFASRFEDEKIQPNQKAFLNVCFKNYKIKSFSKENAVVEFVLCQSGFIVFNDDANTMSSNNPEISTLSETVKVVSFVGNGKTNFISETPLIARESIKKLLLTESQISIKDVEGGVDFVTISGEVVNRVLYLTENDRFESAYVFESFKEEVEIDGVTRDCLVEGGGFVKYSDIKAEVENNGKGAKITITVPVELYGVAFKEEEVAVIQDIYSTENELEIITETFEMSRNCPFEMVEGKVDGSVTLDDDKPRVDKILFNLGNLAEVTNVYVDEDMLKVEGVARTCVVYLNDDTNTINTTEVEIPFVLQERTSVSKDASLEARAIILDSDVVVKKGRELFYEAKVKSLVYVDEKEVSAVISNILIKEELPRKDFAMEVIFAKAGQTLWEIAKLNRISGELIENQNQEISFPLEADSEIVVFHQKMNNV